jgi:SAM-dependent methyltransferase
MHENLVPGEACTILTNLMEGYFKQAMVHTVNVDYHLLSNKKGEAKILKKKPTKSLASYAHNLKKQYVLEEDTPHDFLVELGIMSEDGKVIKKKYNKFKQINRYLEILEDAIKSVKFDDVIRVVDFGCGKAYLTFAMYYYFVVLKKIPVEIVGLDLKADVIAHLTEIKERLGYDSLIFQQGDIKNFEWDKEPDIVVSLHACDTATDEAIAKAVEWNSKVIMAVPCCQHEAYTQIGQNDQQLVLKHGILKERFSAMATDAIRANLLEIMGYQTIVMEFVDMEHTPKNLMIRGINTGVKKPELLEEYRNFVSYWSLRPHLERLFSKAIKEMQK